MDTQKVRTMSTSLNINLIDISDASKTAIVNDGLLKIDVDITTLQETSVVNAGIIK